MFAEAQRPVSSPIDHFLLRLTALQPLERDTVQELATLVRRPMQIAAYQELLSENAQEDMVHVMLGGLAARYRLLNNGRRQITSILVPGDICDFGFLSGTAVGSNVITLSPGLVGRIGIGQLASLGETHPKIMRALLRSMSVDQAIAQERVTSLGLRTAVERLSHFICEMWFRFSQVGLVQTDLSFQLPITQAEIGEALGLSTVHVNRTLQVLRGDGLITMRNGRVGICDGDKLKQVAGFSAEYLQM